MHPRQRCGPCGCHLQGPFCRLTAVDDGNGGGHQVASAAVAVRVPGVVKGAAEEVDGVALEAESDVGVDGGGDADVGVAEEFLDHDEFDSLFQEQGRGRVPEVVKSDAAEAGLAEERGEGAGEVGRVDRSALRCSEYVPPVLPRTACGLTFALLLFVVELQGLGAAGGEGDAAFGGPGLGGQRGKPACAGALECAADGGGARSEVEVFPAQAEEFALAESGVEGEFEQGLQAVFVRGGEESAGFVGGEGFEASGPRRAGADVAGHVARDLLLTHGVLQGGLEHGMDVGQSQRGEQLATALACSAAARLVAPGVDATRAALAGSAELVESGADVLGGELGELLLAEAGDEVPVDAGGIAGVGVLAEVVDGDVFQPVRQVRGHAALRGGSGEAAVAGGDLLGELGQRFFAGGAVDVDAFAGVADPAGLFGHAARERPRRAR